MKKIFSTTLLALSCMLMAQAQQLKVLYLTSATEANAADNEVLATLKANFNVRVSSYAGAAPTSGDSIAKWNADPNIDVLVYSEFGNNMGTTSYYYASTKPVLIMNARALAQTRMAWAKTAGTADGTAFEQNRIATKYVTVSDNDKAHAIFAGLTFEGNDLKLLDSVATVGADYKGLIAIENKVAAPAGLGVLREAVAERPNTNQAVFYHPIGTKANGVNALAADWCFIGITSLSYNFISANAKLLLVNAVNALAVGSPDPCDSVTCDSGYHCEYGDCILNDPCEGVACPAGQHCDNGDCVGDPDPCEGIVCPAGRRCENGSCVVNPNPCEGVTCPVGKHCNNGVCVDDEATAVAADKASTVKVYPSPADDVLYVESEKGMQRVELYSLADGALLLSVSASGTSATISLQGLSAGSYAVVVRMESGKPQMLKIVKQ